VASLDRETSISTGSAGSGGDSAALAVVAKRLHEQFSMAVEALRKLYNSKLKELKEKAVVHETMAARLFGAIKDKLSEVVEVQNKLVVELKLVASKSTSATPGLDKLLGSFGAGAPDTSTKQIEALVKEVKALCTEVWQAKNEEGNDSVKIGGVIFCSKEDVHAWMLDWLHMGPLAPLWIFIHSSSRYSSR
jgi:hypothetical protein